MSPPICNDNAVEKTLVDSEQDARRQGFQDRERDYFDTLVGRTGDTWWGNTSPAGCLRLDRRAEIIAAAIPRNSRVLELGCGAGALTLRVLRLAPHSELSACDISSVAVATARSRCDGFSNVDFIVCDILNLPALGKFDMIVGNGILHHLPLNAAIQVVVDFLHPQGEIVFFEPNLANPHVAIEKTFPTVGRLLGNTEDEKAFSRFRVASVLRKHHFSSVAVTPIDFIHPKTPEILLPMVRRAGAWMEQTPLIREFAGSMLIRAKRLG